jgi:hypothetical protein
MKRLQQILGVLVLIASPALADQYTFTDLNHNASATGLTGTVTVTQDGTDTVKIDVEGDFNWVNAGTGNGYQFFFNLLNSPVLAKTAVTFLNPTAGWTFSGGPTSGIPGDGLSGDFKYGVSCEGTGDPCAGGGSSSTATPPLVFDVSASGLTPASFMVAVTDSPYTIYFAADAGINGNTGLTGATLTSVPDGGMTVMLLGGALVGLETLRRRLRA